MREAKLNTERLLYAAGFAPGLIPGIREVIISAEIVGAGGFRFLRDTVIELSEYGTPRVSVVSDSKGLLTVDCNGHYGPFVGPELLDLVSDRIQRKQSTAVLATNVCTPDLLSGLNPLIKRQGIAAAILSGSRDPNLRLSITAGDRATPVLTGSPCPSHGPRALEGEHATSSTASIFGGESTLIFAAALPNPQRLAEQHWDSEHWHVLQHGFAVEDELWWTVYHAANAALTPSTEISRRHTGSTAKPEWS